LEAVVLKAMALDQSKRYDSVAEFQKEISAYQQGYATEAEHAGFLKRLQLLMLRNRAISGAACAVTVVILLAAISLAREAEHSAQALSRLRKAAPTLVERAWGHLEEGRLDDALEKVSFATEVDPANADYQMLRGRLLQAKGQLSEANAAFQRTYKIRKDAIAAENLEVCAQLLPAAKGADLPVTAKAVLVHMMQRQGRPQDTLLLIADLKKQANELRPLLEQRLKAIPGWEPRRLKQTSDGTFSMDFSWLKLESVDCLDGMPISDLTLNACAASITKELLAKIAGLPLKTLSMRGCNLGDLTFLKDTHVENLVLTDNPFVDISPLKNLPLFKLNLRESATDDLSPLSACSHLEELVLPPKKTNYEALKSNPTLKRISRKELNNGSPDQTAAEFWKTIPSEAGR
jgi:tetratricopeptide (TPR) repeat protein